MSLADSDTAKRDETTQAVEGDDAATDGRTLAAGINAGRGQPTEAGFLGERPVNVADDGPANDGVTSRGTDNSEGTTDLIDLSDVNDVGRGDGDPDGIRSADGDSDSAHVSCLIDRLPPSLTVDQRTIAADLIRANATLFSRSEEDIGRTN